MRPMQRLISAGFATAAIASASVPALAWTVWPDVDFAWYADVGRPVATRAVQAPAPPTAPYTAAVRDERPVRVPAVIVEDRAADALATDVPSSRPRDERAMEPAEAVRADEAPK